MATTDKPTDGATAKPPAPRKPATPRKTVRKTAASAAPKPDARKSDTTASSSADTAPTPAHSSATSSATAAAKSIAPRKRAPSARKPAAPKSTTPRASVAKSGAARSTTAKSDRKPTGTGTGRRWGIAAAVSAAGVAVTAGLLALRGSTPAKDDPAKPNAGKTAHQADGTDSSRSFEAGIADKGTVPE